MKKVRSGKGNGRELKGFFLIFEEENGIKSQNIIKLAT
jgi:hypothetical protein